MPQPYSIQHRQHTRLFECFIINHCAIKFYNVNRTSVLCCMRKYFNLKYVYGDNGGLGWSLMMLLRALCLWYILYIILIFIKFKAFVYIFSRHYYVRSWEREGCLWRYDIWFRATEAIYERGSFMKAVELLAYKHFWGLLNERLYNFLFNILCCVYIILPRQCFLNIFWRHYGICPRDLWNLFCSRYSL